METTVGIMENPFARRCHEALSEGSLKLPTLPDLALRINEIALSDRATAAQIAEAIASDPAIAARLVRAANSAASASRIRVQSLQAAVTRLGLQYTRALVNRLALEHMYLARSPALQQVAHDTWERSVDAAALCEVLATQHSDLRPEVAMLAGLLHMVGVLPLISMADNEPGLLQDDNEPLAELEAMHPEIGSLVLKHWQFAPMLQEVPLAAADIHRYHIGPADYADLVIVARVQQMPEDAEARQGPLPAFSKLQLDPARPLLGSDAFRQSHERAMARLAG